MKREAGTAVVLIALALLAGSATRSVRTVYAQSNEPGTCGSPHAFAGQTSVYGTDYWIYGTGVKLADRGLSEAMAPRAKYSMPNEWFYNSLYQENATQRMKASAVDVECWNLVQAGGFTIGYIIPYYWYGLTLTNVTEEETLTQCEDGSYVDDPSSCESSGGGGGGGEGGGGGGDGENVDYYYYLCYFTYWSDGTVDVSCTGPYQY